MPLSSPGLSAWRRKYCLFFLLPVPDAWSGGDSAWALLSGKQLGSRWLGRSQAPSVPPALLTEGDTGDRWALISGDTGTHCPFILNFSLGGLFLFYPNICVLMCMSVFMLMYKCTCILVCICITAYMCNNIWSCCNMIVCTLKQICVTTYVHTQWHPTYVHTVIHTWLCV